MTVRIKIRHYCLFANVIDGNFRFYPGKREISSCQSNSWVPAISAHGEFSPLSSAIG